MENLKLKTRIGRVLEINCLTKHPNQRRFHPEIIMCADLQNYVLEKLDLKQFGVQMLWFQETSNLRLTVLTNE